MKIQNFLSSLMRFFVKIPILLALNRVISHLLPVFLHLLKQKLHLLLQVTSEKKRKKSLFAKVYT